MLILCLHKINQNGQDVYLDYSLDLISENLDAGETSSVNTTFNYSIDGSVSVLNGTATYDTTGFDLKAGSQIGISFNLGHSQFSLIAQCYHLLTASA